MAKFFGVFLFLSLATAGLCDCGIVLHEQENNKSAPVCLRMNASVFVNITQKHANKTKVSTYIFNGSSCSNISGYCDPSKTSKTQRAREAWFTVKTKAQGDLLLNFTFVGNLAHGHRKWSMTSVFLNYSSDLFDANGTMRSLTTALDYTRSFKCKSQRHFSVTSDTTHRSNTMAPAKVTMDLFFSNMQLEAFEFVKHPYDVVYQCNADTKGSKIVPIAVGCVLVGLVSIVILAYIVGRLRSHKRRSSYEALS